MVRTGSAKTTDLSNSRKLKLAYGAPTPKKKLSEKQGPIDWSCFGLKSKYRGEAEREEAWREWLNSASMSKTAMNESELILPVTKVERHPFYTLFYKRLYEENLLSSNRTQARLLMKRFVFDVEEVWLTNLHHLQEHKPENLFRSEDDSRHGSTNSSVASSSPSKTQKVVESGGMNFGRGNGIKNRRDVKALSDGKSQIPSISQQRVFDKAYHTTRLPAINVMLDYVPEPTPALKFDKLIPPTIEPLIDSIPLVLDPSVEPVSHHNQIPGRGFQFYTENDYMLHIDRLIPSSDYLVNIQSEVVWRFSLYRQTDMHHQYFIAAEANIAGYVAYTLNQNNQNGTHPVPVVNQLVFTTSELVPLSWEGAPSSESFATVTVGLMGYEKSPSRGIKPDDSSPHTRIKTIKLGLNVSVRPGASDQPSADAEPWRNFYCECCPAEVKHLLRIPTTQLLTDLDFWLHTDRVVDLYPLLVSKLVLQFSSGEMVGVAFQSGVRTAVDRVPEALSTLEALSCAYELLDLLSLSPFVEPEKPRVEEVVDDEEEEGGGDNHRSHKKKGKKAAKKAAKAKAAAAAAAAAAVPVFKSLPELQFSRANTQFLIRPNVLAPEVKPYKMPMAPSASTTAAAAAAAAHHSDNEDDAVSHSPPSSPSTRPRHPDSGTSSSSNSGKHTHHASHRHHSQQHRGVSSPDSKTDQPTTTTTSNLLETDRDMVLNANIYRGLWEDIVSFSGHNLSVVASGGLAVISQVPGCAEVGRYGLWFPDHNIAPMECTQAAARYFRDVQKSTTDSVLVNMTLALDTALLFATLIAWEDYSTHPVVNPAEEVTGIVPARCFSSVALVVDPVHSPITDRPSNTVVIFGTLPVEGIDFMPRNAPTKPKGYCRDLPFRNQWGFRQQTEVTLLGVDPVLSTMVYGITRLGAQPNVLQVNPRNIWHRTIPITEHINRPRLPKDYHYIIANITTCGANDPTSYTTRMKASKMVGLTSSAFKKYEDKYNDIKELRSVFHRQLALDTKIEKVQNDLKIKEKLHMSQIRDELQRGYEKKLRKATKSEIGWRSRFKMSSLIEIQGNWERRRDDRSGLYFFRRITPAFYDEQGRRENLEKFAETCQWEVPPSWDGDPLSGGSAVNTVQGGGLVEGSTVLPATAKAEVRPKLYTSSGASYYSEIEEEDLDLYDMPQVTAQKRQTAGIPLHHMNAGKSAGMASAGIAGGGGGGGGGVKKGAFDQPSDSWLPANNSKQYATQQSITSGNVKDRETQRLHDPHNLDYKDRNSKRRQRDSVASIESRDLGSVGADKSVDESIAATIDTVNLEHIAEQLVSSDELMRVIARRLGLPESQIVPAEDLSSVFSVTSGKVPHVHGSNILHAPRDEWIDDLNEPEFDSDDDLWSDDDHAVGDYDVDKHIGEREDMPTNQLEAARLKRRQWREIHNKENFNAPVSVPYLHLPGAGGGDAANGAAGGVKSREEESREEVFGWRRLPRPVLKEGFLSSSLLTHTRGPEKTSSNTLPAPIFLLPISPVDACKYVPTEFTAQIESIFIPDAKKDMERSIATVERNIKREEELSRNLPTDDLLLFGEAKEMTSVDAYLARQAQADREQVADPVEAAITKAILAAKSSNIAAMEDALAEDIPINTADEFGNSLLILAAQQGSKRMCKFLLRRGANINFQSLAGNTPLHYCYAYSFHKLGDYLKSKGANDAIVNVDGLTCYEGLSKEGMAINYGDVEGDDEGEVYDEEEGDYDEGEDDDYYD